MNKKFFDDKIMEPDIIHFVNMSHDGLSNLIPGGGGELMINQDFKKHPDAACYVLMHEMIHHLLGYEYKEIHGYRFAAEINRLWNIGAYERLL